MEWELEWLYDRFEGGEDLGSEVRSDGGGGV